MRKMRWLVGAATLGLITGCLRQPVDGGGTVGTSGSATTGSPVTSGTPPTTTTTSNPTTATTGDGTTEPTSDSNDTTPLVWDFDVPDEPVVCDQWVENCPPGEKCMPWASQGPTWDAHKCTPLNPDAAGLYEPCTVEGSAVSGVDNCELHMMCWNVDPMTNVGTCYGMCIGSPNDAGCVDAEAHCLLTGDGVLTLCFPDCDPLLQECKADEVCVFTGNDFSCTTDDSGDAGVYGDPCEYLNVCDPGLFCANADFIPGCGGSVGCCTEFCDLDDPQGDAQCAGEPEGVECGPFYEAGAEPPGGENLGACVLP
jgi:hypothetical protein